MSCRHCGHNEKTKSRGLVGLEVLTILIVGVISCYFLSIFGLIVPIIYYIYVESTPICRKCAKRF